MSVPSFLVHDGKMRRSGIPLISPDNRSFRYGDGFFETMRVVNGKLMLEDLHMERLFNSLELLRFQPPKYFTPSYITDQVAGLVLKNQHAALARVRLTVFRGEGGLYDTEDAFPHYLIQSWPLEPATQSLNQNGLELGVYTTARKTCDGFSHVKSNNYLAYVMAALWARENKWNDAIVLNAHDRVADTTIANLFIVKDGTIRTPSLAEGCVAGVMRRHLLHHLRKENMPVEETMLTIDDVMQASEIFLTNAIAGVKWVKSVGQSSYTNSLATLLHRQLMHV